MSAGNAEEVVVGLDDSLPEPLISADADEAIAAEPARTASRLAREYRILHQIVAGTHAGISVMDTDLRYLYINPRMARMNGLPAEAHLGRTLREVLPGVHRPDAVLHKVLADGKPRELVGTGHTQVDSPYERREWRVTYHRIEDERARIIGIAGIGLEITEPRQYLHGLERAHQRMALLDTAATSIGTTLDVESTCKEVADFVVPGLADAASVDLFDEDRPGHRLHSEPGVMRLRRMAFTAPPYLAKSLARLTDLEGFVEYDASSPLRTRLESGLPWVHNLRADPTLPGDDGGRYARRLAQYLAAGVHSALVVPLATESRQLGMLSMVRCAPAPAFTREDTAVAQELAARAARALERSLQFAREHTMALELQRALLSEPHLPNPNVETATRYLPATDGTLVGGDWFDILALPRNRNLLVIGDVMGHGVEAAVAMSNYRSMVRAMAAAELPLDEVLFHADRMVAESGFERVATCLLALGDPYTDTVTYANAGHLPPLRLSPAGDTELVPVPAGPPLGTGLGGYTTVTRPGLPGGTLIFYTDGLVERRDEDIDTSLHRLTRLHLRPQDTLDQILDAVLAQLTDGPARDDIALIAARPCRPRQS
ncbi:SpoIIE family protein phosphatase [Streptomyces sp. N35]|uniref:SpoIIE family protein phosphatase n=1 Tax=Streptomyces sp. N35 TaxID=2795730 RepID=UPI0018F31CEE|nr:SpoIIE family protein phosphatase [Streptomyces sp. N35]